MAAWEVHAVRPRSSAATVMAVLQLWASFVFGRKRGLLVDRSEVGKQEWAIGPLLPRLAVEGRAVRLRVAPPGRVVARLALPLGERVRRATDLRNAGDEAPSGRAL